MKLKPIRIIASAIAIVAVLLVSFLVWGYISLRRSLPIVTGEQFVDGVNQKVRVHRDPWGVPHIVAQNDHDLFYASGYVTAQDRLWQMDIFRRAAKGELAAIYGREFLDVDKLARTIGFYRIAQQIVMQMNGEARDIIQAYSDGINAYIDETKGKLPIEFSLVRYQPELWHPEDSVAFQRLVAWFLTMGWYVDLVYGQLLDKYGEDSIAELLPSYPNTAPTVIANSSHLSAEFARNLVANDSKLAGLLGMVRIGVGSNAWAVTGSKTANGQPLLANDPHLGFSAPCIFYEMHLSSPNYNVAGVGFPGLPGIVIGHNRHIAWGITNGMIDDADFFIEQIDPVDSSRYVFKSDYHSFINREELIKLKGDDPVHYTVRETRHGPVITEINSSSKSSRDIITLRWSGSNTSNELAGFLKLLRAKDWDDFAAALTHFGVPALNFVFADTAGNIGYHLAGAIPIRKNGFGLFPASGSSGGEEWLGFIPFQQLPQTYNPESGIIVSANNKITGEHYPFHLSNYWEPPYRVERIQALLSSNDSLTVDDFKNIQLDLQSLLAAEIVPFIKEALSSLQLKKGDPLEQAYQLLNNWDYKESPESISAAIFNSFYIRFLRNIFEDEMGSEFLDQFIQLPNIPIRVVSNLMHKGRSKWFDDTRTPNEVETMETIILRSIRESLDSLATQLGELGAWQWGRLHTLTFFHPYGMKSSLGLFFNIGPFRVGGSYATVNNSTFLFEKPFSAFTGPCTRRIVDLADMNRSLSIITTGQSGQVLSRHYKDQTRLWLDGEYHRVSMDSTTFKGDGWKLLTLIPKQNP